MVEKGEQLERPLANEIKEEHEIVPL